jgi:hypothetical protein
MLGIGNVMTTTHTTTMNHYSVQLIVESLLSVVLLYTGLNGTDKIGTYS